MLEPLNLPNPDAYIILERKGSFSKGRLSDVRKVVSTCKAEIVGLVETKVKKKFLRLCRRLGFWRCCENYSYDPKGRIWLIWSPSR